jgi:hypothetical protein
MLTIQEVDLRVKASLKSFPFWFGRYRFDREEGNGKILYRIFGRGEWIGTFQAIQYGKKIQYGSLEFDTKKHSKEWQFIYEMIILPDLDLADSFEEVGVIFPWECPIPFDILDASTIKCLNQFESDIIYYDRKVITTAQILFEISLYLGGPLGEMLLRKITDQVTVIELKAPPYFIIRSLDEDQQISNNRFTVQMYLPVPMKENRSRCIQLIPDIDRYIQAFSSFIDEIGLKEDTNECEEIERYFADRLYWYEKRAFFKYFTKQFLSLLNEDSVGRYYLHHPTPLEQDEVEIAGNQQPKSKRGPRNYSRDEKIKFLHEWDKLDRDANPITLVDWLEEKFGATGGELNVAKSTFYGWKRLRNS